MHRSDAKTCSVRSGILPLLRWTTACDDSGDLAMRTRRREDSLACHVMPGRGHSIRPSVSYVESIQAAKNSCDMVIDNFDVDAGAVGEAAADLPRSATQCTSHSSVWQANIG